MMSNFFAAIFAALGILVAMGGDNPGVSLTRTLIVVLVLFFAAMVAFRWKEIDDALTGDHRQVRVGHDAKWVSKTQQRSMDPDPSLFERHTVWFGFERDDNPIVAAGRKPVWAEVDPSQLDTPAYLRQGKRRSDGRPVAVRAARDPFSIIKGR